MQAHPEPDVGDKLMGFRKLKEKNWIHGEISGT